MQTFARLLVLALLGLLTGCGGASAFDQDSSPPDALQGAWFGTIDTNLAAMGTFQTVQFEINRKGRIVEILIGGVDTGLTGTRIGPSNGLRQYFLGGTDEMFISLDSDGTGFGFIINDSRVGVVQRGAMPPLTFDDNDIDGTYIGTEFVFDSTYDVLDARAARVVTNPMATPIDFDSQLDEPPSCTATGDLNSVEPSFGVFENGSFSDTTTAPPPTPPTPGCLTPGGQLNVYVSADADLLVAVACDSGFGVATIPDDCRFSMFER